MKKITSAGRMLTRKELKLAFGGLAGGGGGSLDCSANCPPGKAAKCLGAWDKCERTGIDSNGYETGVRCTLGGKPNEYYCS